MKVNIHKTNKLYCLVKRFCQFYFILSSIYLLFHHALVEFLNPELLWAFLTLEYLKSAEILIARHPPQQTTKTLNTAERSRAIPIIEKLGTMESQNALSKLYHLNPIHSKILHVHEIRNHYSFSLLQSS